MRSEQTKDMTDEELQDVQKKVENMTDEELAIFRNSFDEDSMGFYGEEGEVK